MKIASCCLVAALAAGILAATSTASENELSRDRQELEAFEEILGVLHSTAAKRQKKEYLKLNVNLHTAMVREVEQAAYKMRRARVESAQGATPSRGGTHDLWTPEGRHERMVEIVREAEDLLPGLQKWDRAAVARNRDILDEFLEILVTDLKASGGTWRSERSG